jgi:hypothetical protein
VNFRRHSELEGKHAILSASSWRWINDDTESLTKRICSQYLSPIGTILHDIARKHIKHRIKLNKYDKKNVMLELVEQGVPAMVIDTINFDSMYENLMRYVNDGVAFKMTPEVVLQYSNNFFGTTDAINYNEESRFLRIHDYKSGTTPAHIEQLIIYAALFCLEYVIKPTSLSGCELRIYQGPEPIIYEPTAEEILNVMETIVAFNNFMNKMWEEE